MTQFNLDDLVENPWNVNHLNAFQYAKLLESIREFGFTDPILARPHPTLTGKCEIIGGKHRWQAATELGIKILPGILVYVDDAQAKKLSIIDNELHGQADPTELAELLKELQLDLGQGFLDALPFTEDILSGFLGVELSIPDPARLPTPLAGPSSPPGVGAGTWVERTYRMPHEVAQLLDEAMEKAKGEFVDPDQPPHLLLEVLAAEYIAS